MRRSFILCFLLFAGSIVWGQLLPTILNIVPESFPGANDGSITFYVTDPGWPDNSNCSQCYCVDPSNPGVSFYAWIDTVAVRDNFYYNYHPITTIGYHTYKASGLFSDYYTIEQHTLYSNTCEPVPALGISSIEVTVPLALCGIDTFSTCSDSFSDGSGIYDYLNNSNCKWLIQRPSGIIELTIDGNTEVNADLIKIYDGSSNAAPLLATLSGSITNSKTLSTSSSLFIEFSTNGTVSGDGFDASYVSTPTPVITGIPYLCGTTGTTTLSVSPSYAGTSYSWYAGNTLLTTGPSFTCTSLGTYSVYANGNTGCPSNNNTLTVSDGTPIVAYTNSTVCSGTNIPLQGNCNGGYICSLYNYSWSPSTYLNSASISNPTFNGSTSTTYNVTVSNSLLPSCSTNYTKTVTVLPTVASNLAGPDKTVCGVYSTMIGSAAITGYSYTWYCILGTNAITNANSSMAYVSPTVLSKYVLAATYNGCTKYDTVVVNVNPLPVANAGPDKVTCAGASVLIGVSTPPNSGLTYAWSPSTGVNNPAIAYPTATVQTNTQYILTVTNTTTGCIKKDTTLVSISPNPAPITNAGIDKTICKGTPTSIGTSAVAGYTYNWFPTTGLSASTSAMPNANPLVTTTYIVSVLDPSVSCIKKDTVVVTVNALPIANAGTDKSICMGTSTALGTTAVAGMTYTWTPATGLSNAFISNPVANPSTNTDYVLTVTNATTGCLKKDTVNIVVKPLPIANAGIDKSICLGQSVAIGAAAVTGYTYTWTPSSSLSNSTVANPTATATTTTNYILTATLNGCTKKDTAKVTVNPLPVANAGLDKSICMGTSTTIGSTAVSGLTYSWTPSTGLSTSTLAMPTANPTSNTTYFLKVSNITTGCIKYDTMNLILTPLPIANAGIDKTICKGTPSTIGTSAVAGYTYNWFPTTGLSASTSAMPNANPLVTTTYIVSVLDPSVSCIKKDTVVVTVNALPIANAGTDKSICMGTSTALGTTAVAGMTYTWTPATGLSNAFISNPVANPTTNTAYVLTVTNATTGCLKKDTVNILVKPLPIANAGIDKTICSGQTAGIGAASVAGYTYAWVPSGSLSSATAANPNTSATATTNYILTATLNGCTKKDTAKVTVNPLPTANAGIDKTMCTGSPITIGASTVAGMNYAWIPTTGLSSASVANPTANPAATNIYALTVTNNTTGCTKKDTVKITVNPLPVANAGLDKSICTGTSATIGSTAVSGLTYSWTPSTGLSTSTLAMPTANPTTNTTYALKVSNTTTGCIKRDTMNLIIKPLPIANAGIDKTICSGQTAGIGAASVAGYTYAWIPSGSLSSATAANPNTSATATTNYILTATLNGCTKKDTAKVTVNPLPTANAGIDKTVVTGNTTTIGIVGSAANTYTWSPTTGLNNPSISNPTCTPLATTTYTLSVTTIATGCSKTDQVLVTATSPQPRNHQGDETIESEAVAAFQIYPNPTSEKLFVQSVGEIKGECKLQLQDALGKMIWEHSTTGKIQIEMDMQVLPIGLYFLHIQTDDNSQSIRVVKE